MVTQLEALSQQVALDLELFSKMAVLGLDFARGTVGGDSRDVAQEAFQVAICYLNQIANDKLLPACGTHGSCREQIGPTAQPRLRTQGGSFELFSSTETGDPVS